MAIDHRPAGASARSVLAITAVVASSVVVGCSSPATTTAPLASTAERTGATTGTHQLSGQPVIDPGDGRDYRPVLDPKNFVDVIDNPYLPFPAGASWRYEGTADGEAEIIEVTVTGERKEIMGISAVVVRDTVSVVGAVVEDTYDWYAQDAQGNVWYLGEDVKDFENGQVVSTAGSWEAGVDGALPGIVMPGVPAPGDPYRQEYYAGEAEDMMQILEVGSSLTAGGRVYDDVVRTRDWSPLEPDVVEEKAYARGVGKIVERKTIGGDGFAELVSSSLPG